MLVPLAEKMRPKSIEEIVGQKHLVSEGKALRNIIQAGNIPNLIFYGPPGVGKTTLAEIIAKQSNKVLRKLNGTSAATSDIKSIFDEIGTFSATNGIVLYLDEIQYLNKKQQQLLLEYTENGKITLIASTTENPYFYVYNAILSRSMVFEFKAVDCAEIAKIVIRAFEYIKDENGKAINFSKNVVDKISRASNGDVRKAINIVEFAVLSTEKHGDNYVIEEETIDELVQKNTMKYDKTGDEHYDLLSAFQKSMRGSDPDAALHYLARLICAGDIVSVCRRLMVCACEDVGLAYPQILPIVKSAVDIAFQLGMPEARIALADAVVLVSLAPKSNSAYEGINKAMQDIESGCGVNVPRSLQNMHYDGDDCKNKGQFYLYPHEYPKHWVKQEYLPEDLIKRKYYNYADNKIERGFKSYWDEIKK